ncbi:PH and SEC7 domain-containing protein 1 isoform X3 [Silurus asotus]|uniref:PH and SEC7 domain-containing protein 1 isoform X3 n=1 Tax=Silurus asotus TaxID=30991 RepID=A0AAD5AGZ8_SILAS|nr:PH and SEC7 domain-containing protein 1 isoform X3 [Silurus asotus]
MAVNNEQKSSPSTPQKKNVAPRATDQTEEDMKNIQMCMKAQILARHLYQQEVYKIPELIRQAINDQEFAEETLKAYVTYFKFESMPFDEALRTFLKVFWPEDELKLQRLLINHFSQQYIACNKLQPEVLPELYKLGYAIIMLNADLHGGHKGKKMTCSEFLANLTRTRSNQHKYNPVHLMKTYNSIKTQKLQVFSVKTRWQNTPSEIDYIAKAGHLICKRVMDGNGRKTRKGRRSWKPFTAVLKDMVLQLQNDIIAHKITIRLHHAVAYPLEHNKRPHVLFLKTADSSVYYFQTESEEQQRSWVATINQIAARYSAPPLTSASSSNKEKRPQVLPTFSSPLSLKQQLKFLKDQLKKFSTHDMVEFTALQNREDTLPFDYMQQEVMRYTTYVSALEKAVKKS